MASSQQNIQISQISGYPIRSPIVLSDLLLLPIVEAVRAPRGSTLYALDLKNKVSPWQHHFADAQISGIALAGETILVATYSIDPLGREGAVHALDPAGEVRWRWAPGVQRVSAPAAAEGAVCFTVDAKMLVTLDLANGEERFRIPLSGIASLSAPALAGDVVYIPCPKPYLIAVRLGGEVLWRYIDDASDVWLDKTPVVAAGRVFTVLSSGAVIALDAESGARLWCTGVGPAGKSLSAPVTDGERLYVGARDGLHALTLDNGTRVWHVETARRIVARSVVHAGVVYATGHDHYLYAVDAGSGKEIVKHVVGQRRIEVSPVLASYAGAPCVIVADRGGAVSAIPRPLSAAEHEAAGDWARAAAAYAELGHTARAAQILEDHDEPLQAAELWEEAAELERAAELYEAAGAWRQAVALWEKLRKPLRRANALESHARSLVDTSCSPEERAAAWEAAALAYVVEGEERQAVVCRGEATRYLRLPVITMDVEIDKGLVLDAWSRLRFIVRNEGHGLARNIFVRASGKEFEGQVMHTQEIFALKAGQERIRKLDICPRAYGDSVPLRVQIDYQDRTEKIHSCTHTIYIPVARNKATRSEAQTVYNVFVSGSGAAAVGEGAVAAGAHGMAIGGDVQGDVNIGPAPAPTPAQGETDAHRTKWNTEAIRRLLFEALSSEELMVVCYDHFRPVYENFASGMTRTQMIQLLMDYCERRGFMDELLACVQERNPAQYERFKDRLRR